MVFRHSKPVLEQGFSTSDSLLDELILFMSGSLDMIVLQVLSWVGEASTNIRSDGIGGEVANYHSLLRSEKKHICIFTVFSKNKWDTSLSVECWSHKNV